MTPTSRRAHRRYRYLLGDSRRKAARLRAGGLLAIEDYHRQTWTMNPRPPEWLDFIAADHATTTRTASAGGRARGRRVEWFPSR